MLATDRVVALDSARTFITLLVVLYHAVINYTHFGIGGDRMRWIGFDLAAVPGLRSALAGRREVSDRVRRHAVSELGRDAGAAQDCFRRADDLKNGGPHERHRPRTS